MKLFIVTATAAALVAVAGIASAQTVNTNAGIKANADVQSTTRHKRHHRATTGASVSTGIETRDNNASAKGSILPGKDRLNSDAFIGAK